MRESSRWATRPPQSLRIRRNLQTTEKAQMDQSGLDGLAGSGEEGDHPTCPVNVDRHRDGDHLEKIDGDLNRRRRYECEGGCLDANFEDFDDALLVQLGLRLSSSAVFADDVARSGGAFSDRAAGQLYVSGGALFIDVGRGHATAGYERNGVVRQRSGRQIAPNGEAGEKQQEDDGEEIEQYTDVCAMAFRALQ